MKKISIAVLVATLVAVCLFSGCNGAEGGKITDNMQNLTARCHNKRAIVSDVSESIHDATEIITDAASITNITE